MKMNLIFGLVVLLLSTLITFTVRCDASADTISEASGSQVQPTATPTHSEVYSYSYHYYPQADILFRLIFYIIFTICFGIFLTILICTLCKFNHMSNAYRIKKKTLGLIPNSYRVLYVISLPDPVSDNKDRDDFLHNMLKLLASTVRDLSQILEIMFLKSKSLRNESMIFDIDDSKNIIQVISEASEDKKDLLIFIDTPGGDLVSSDEICTALRTYQSIPNRKKKSHGSNVFCVIDKIAQSAGTMMALSADTIYMSRFAVLGPTDPQVTIMHEDYDHGVSCQLYNDMQKSLDKVSELDSSAYLIMKDRQNSYRDNLGMFKTLKQYKMANETNKKKMLNSFCSNSVPHHRGFNIPDLAKMGISISIVQNEHKKILKMLEDYRDEYLLGCI